MIKIKKLVLANLFFLILAQTAYAEKFIAYINGSTNKKSYQNKFLGIVEIEDNVLKSITPISTFEANKLSKKIPFKKNKGEIITIYPSDYKKIKNKDEILVGQKLSKNRKKNWDRYIKKGSYSLFIDQDHGLSSLPDNERQNILDKRNRKWDELTNLYYEADYIGVTEFAPSFYQMPSHRAGAAFLAGVSYSKFNELSNALKELNRSINFKFKNPQVYFEKGKILLSMDKLNESYESFEESLKRNNQRFLSMYYLGWIREIQKNYKAALDHYETLLKENYIDSTTAQSVELRRAEIFDKITSDSTANQSTKSKIISSKVIIPGNKAVDLEPESTNGIRLKQFLQKLQQKFDLPSLIPFKIGSMGNYLRFNQYFTYNTNVPSLTEEVSEFRDSFLTNTIFVYKHFFSTREGFTHTPELRLNYITHFERNIPSIYAEDSFSIAPSFRNSFKHHFAGVPSQFLFDVETSYNLRDYNSDLSNEYFSKSIKLNFGESFNFFNIGGTSLKFRYDIRNYYDSNLDSTTLTFFTNQLFNLSNNRTISIILNADLTSVEADINSTNAYLFRIDYLHPSIIDKWELQTALNFLGTDTKAQSSTRGFETNISYEMEWRRKFLKDFEFALNYNYALNNSKDTTNYQYDKHVIGLELQYTPTF